ncbi:TMEM67 [Acanthosepion pharaonis]|uniref:TMEM67 n=1 Tax=Acanthosepion pharaonis TaxID=158019 RepID=A0A812DDZ6_ACAPH|nr:TMEM67 [Sepia pharaonis]
MAADDFILIIVPILIVVSNVICDYSIKYESVESCQLVREQNEYNYYFDTSQLKCEKCQQKKEIQVTSTNGYSCKCTSRYKYKNVFGNGKVMCELCPNNQTASEDGWHCILDAIKCASCPTDSIKVQREINGSLLRNSQNEAICDCVKCTGDTIPNASQDRCVTCTEILYSSPTANCSCNAPLKLAYNTCVAEILSNPVFTIQLVNGESPESNFLKNNLPKAYGQCKVNLSNQKACQTLGNMCVLLYYNYEGRRQKNMKQACQLFRSLSALAQRRYAVDAWYCELSVKDLFDTEKYPLEFYDLYLEYSSNGKYLQAVPVLIENYLGESDARDNLGNIDNWLLTRRFFLVDNVATKNTLSPDRAEYLRYASSMTLVIQLQPEKDGNIFTPYLKISYAEVHSDDANLNRKVQVSFQSEYIQNEANIQRNIDTAIGTLSGLGVLWACLNTWIWSKRAGRIAIDFATLINLLFNVCASLSNVLFINILGIGLYFLIFFKRQDIVVIMPLVGSSLTKTYASYIVIAFVFKLFDLFYLMFRQCTIDIFFIDWERPTRQQKDAPVSAWRTLFVANEWNEIQTIRRTHTSFQLMMVNYFLVVVGFENLSKNNPSLSLTADETDLFIPQNLMFRFTLASTIYLIVGE